MSLGEERRHTWSGLNLRSGGLLYASARQQSVGGTVRLHLYTFKNCQDFYNVVIDYFLNFSVAVKMLDVANSKMKYSLL